MIDIVSPVGKLLEDLTLKRLMGVLLLLAVVLAFERYTSSFQLSRIQRSAEVLSLLQQIQRDGIAQDPVLAPIHADLVRELQATLNTPPLSLRLPSIATRPAPANVSYLKFFWGALPWLLLTVVTLPAIFKREENAASGLLSVLFFAAIFGSIGASLPTYWPWLNVYLYPWGVFFAIAAFVIVLGVWYAKRDGSVSAPPAQQVASVDEGRGMHSE